MRRCRPPWGLSSWLSPYVAAHSRRARLAENLKTQATPPAGGLEWLQMPRPTGSLRALLGNLIDYAGLYPPAALPLIIVTERYRGFRASPEKWILNRLVLPTDKYCDSAVEPDWPVTLLVDDEPGPLPAQVETLEIKQARRLSLPTYCEAPPEQITEGWAKFRTGGLTPESIPTTAEVAAFLMSAAARRLAFKATAGLHHPIRAVHALTYTPESPRAVTHGFLNVFAAAAFAWHGMDLGHVIELLEETAVGTLDFGDEDLIWNGHRLTTEQIVEARRDFAHSFGSCSFEEPVAELREMELLP
jgi:hypothetical protein